MPSQEFFKQHIVAMKNIQAPQQPSKIVVESRDHKESVNLAKLQNGMLQLMYATGNVNWDDGTVKNIRTAIFTQGFMTLLSRSAAVQAASLTNLFNTIFTSKQEDDYDDSALHPLNRLMSLVVFPPKFVKGHLNASFQSSNLKSWTIYKSASIHPFHCAPQYNQKLVKDATIEMEAEQNKVNWRIGKKDRKQVTSLIEGVGRVTTMEHVAMTCANICGVQHAIVDVATAKPLLYQFAWRLIKFIKKRDTKTWMRDNKNLLVHLPMVFMSKIHQFFMHLASFLQT
jgi:hypothetical protein